MENGECCGSLWTIDRCWEPTISKQLDEVGLHAFTAAEIDGDLVNAVTVDHDKIASRGRKMA